MASVHDRSEDYDHSLVVGPTFGAQPGAISRIGIGLGRALVLRGAGRGDERRDRIRRGECRRGLPGLAVRPVGDARVVPTDRVAGPLDLEE
jgi:hypothetical protein